MRKNIVSVGNKPIRGEIGKIYAAGDVNIIEADVLKLSGAGDITITDSFIAETKIAGKIEANNSNFKTISSAGEMRCKGICKADELLVIGKLDAEQLECGILRNFSEKSIQIHNAKLKKETSFRINNWEFNINSKFKSDIDEDDVTGSQEYNQKKEKILNSTCGSIFKGNIKAETFENLCDFNLDFKYNFKYVLSIDPLHSAGVMECEELYSFGALDMEGVNAEVIYIHPSSTSKIKQVMGSDIMITEVFPIDEAFKKIPKTADLRLYSRAAALPASMMEIDSIEGDIIMLDHVQAKEVSGDKVVIGDNCIIDRLEYKTSIEISDKATVKDLIQI